MLSRQASVQSLQVLSCFLDQLRPEVLRRHPVCKVLTSPTFVPATKPNHDHTNNSERAEVTSKCNEYSMDDGIGPSVPVGGSAMGVPSTYPSFRAVVVGHSNL